MGVICFRASPRVRVCKLKLSAVLNSQTSPACCRSVMYIFQTSLFLTGSYDGIVRIYNESLELLQTAGGHSAPVSDASWIPPSTSVPTSRFLSSSYDTTARIYSYDPDENNTPTALASLRLHTRPISSIRPNPSGELALTAGWDNLIGLWTLTIPDNHEVGAEEELPKSRFRKRRKLGKGNELDSSTIEPEVVRKAPAYVLKSHTGRVSKALFDQGRQNDAWSVGWDCTVRKWDIETGVCTETVVSPEIRFSSFSLSHPILADLVDVVGEGHDGPRHYRRLAKGLGGFSRSKYFSVLGFRYVGNPTCPELHSSTRADYLT